MSIVLIQYVRKVEILLKERLRTQSFGGGGNTLFVCWKEKIFKKCTYV